MSKNISVNDHLLKEALALSEIKNANELLETALAAFIKKIKKQKLAALSGKINWEGNLNEMRLGRKL
jgi:hypothetical protein